MGWVDKIRKHLPGASDEDAKPIERHPRHEQARQQDRADEKAEGSTRRAGSYALPPKAHYKRLDEALDVDVPPVKERRE